MAGSTKAEEMKRTLEIVSGRRREPQRTARNLGGSHSRLADDRGDVAPMAIMFGLATVMVFFVIQVALLFHARSVVSAAAQDGVRAAQVENATASDAHDAASQILSGSTGLLNNESVVVTPSGEFVTVTVTADVTPVVFGLTGPVTASASGVIERFRPQSER